MAKTWISALVASIALTCTICLAQTASPAHLPELKYPPIARTARIQGDAIISFKNTLIGNTVEVKSLSGHPMLRNTAIENVRAWLFAPIDKPDDKAHKVVFHFQLNPPSDGFDDDIQPATTMELDETGGVRVLSTYATGLRRTKCPSTTERELPPAVISGDYVELQSWNENVKVSADGSITWKYRETARQAQIAPSKAISILEQLRTQSVWDLCGYYSQSWLSDGDSSFIKLRIGGREKSVGEYGDAAPSIFSKIELLVDETANTHQWRHGDPKDESVIEISAEYLPKLGKTELMEAAPDGAEARYKAALAAGDKLTDIDASGWTPLMYAAGSYGSSKEREIIQAGADVNARPIRGETALMAAAATGIADEELLRAGADVKAVNDVGMTALMLLVQRGDADEIAILIRAGADAQKKDIAGRTAMDYLEAANCAQPLVKQMDPQWSTTGYSRCNALDQGDYKKVKSATRSPQKVFQF